MQNQLPQLSLATQLAAQATLTAEHTNHQTICGCSFRESNGRIEAFGCTADFQDGTALQPVSRQIPCKNNH
jgi:hypothetical protein